MKSFEALLKSQKNKRNPRKSLEIVNIFVEIIEKHKKSTKIKENQIKSQNIIRNHQKLI